MASLHCIDNELVAGAVEGRVPAQQDVENHSAAPEVTFLIVALLEHFWRDVVGRAELLREPLALLEGAGRPEVYHFDSHFGGVSVDQ